MSRIRFQIIPPIFRPEEKIFISGNVEALGAWDSAKALALEYQPAFHSAEIAAPEGTHLEYKITCGSWETEAVDAYGCVASNFRHEASGNETIRHVVADWKDRFKGQLTSARVHSQILNGDRELLVWLPPGYTTKQKTRFPVIYLNDGDTVFNPQTSVFSGIDWAADEWVIKLRSEGVLPEAIVVAICHPKGFSPEGETLRNGDLSPQRRGAAYAEFLATELVPYIDTHYRTLANAGARTLGGANLGALNSLFTALHYPEIFSRIVCLSTSFEDVTQSLPAHSLQLQAMESAASLPAGVRVYFDYGTVGLDECYEPYHGDLGGILSEKGWKDGREFVIRKIQDGSHDELSWRARFGEALRFLAKK
ncbi:MAG: alpha/beta hydrolase-fold protein [Chthoniobacterales bacterium]